MVNEDYINTIRNLTKIDPVYRVFHDMPGDEKYVFMIEACNNAAKTARDIFKEMRDAAKAANADTSAAKEFDRLSGSLMKSAKSTLIPLALAAGAQAFMSRDDTGESVLILQYETAGRIGLHSVGPTHLPEDVRECIRESDKPLYTGFKRQRLSAATAQAVKDDDTPFLRGVIEASRNQDYANRVFAEFGGRESANEATPKQLRNVFVRLSGSNTPAQALKNGLPEVSSPATYGR